jgi:hypothetical protein
VYIAVVVRTLINISTNCARSVRTSIHHLHEQSRDDNSLSLSDIIDEVNGGMHTFHICIPSQEFTFFFNSTPSQLDPNYQTVSTLTERGKQFSREAGVSHVFVLYLLATASLTM